MMCVRRCARLCLATMALQLLLAPLTALAQSNSSTLPMGTAVLQLHGSGDDAISFEIDKMIDLIASRTKPMVHLSYRGSGTAAAQTEFMGPAGSPSTRAYNDFAIGGIPLSSEQYSTLVQGSATPLQMPLMVAKVAIFSSVPSSALPASSPGLYLSPCTLAKIYLGQITSWSDPAIMADNPDLNTTGAPPLRAVRVAGPSGATRALSAYLSATCPSVWNLGATPNLDGLVPASILAMSYHKAILSALSWAQRTAADNSAMAWAVAYTISHTMMRTGIYEVQLSNAAGARLNSTVVNNTQLALSLSAGGYPAIDADWSAAAMANKAASSEWPMVLVPHLYIRQDASYLGAAGGLLRAWVQLLLSDDAQTILTDEGLVPLPTSMRQDLLTQLGAKLQVASGAPTFVWEDNVMPVQGQADYVISTLRTRYETTELWGREAYVTAELAVLQARMADVLSNLSAAQAVRDQLYHTTQTNAQNAANIAKVQQVAVAGIVLAVLLALVALIVGTVYVSKTKAIDSKYSRIITDWIPGRHDTGMGGVGGPARGGFVNQGF